MGIIYFSEGDIIQKYYVSDDTKNEHNTIMEMWTRHSKCELNDIIVNIGRYCYLGVEEIQGLI